MHDEWERSAGIPKLAQGEVQVWWIELSAENADDTKYLPALNAEETERAGRLRAGQVRTQFLAGRSGVRTLLGAHLGIAPQKVPIVMAEFGKPELDSPSSEKIHFNVAHSRSTILIALNLTAPVGIDIEYLDRKIEVEEVARHSLTEQETSTLLAIDDVAARSKFFFECWTRKEAVVKADGRGLSLPLTSFEAPTESSSRPSSVTILNMDRLFQRTYFVSDIAIVEGAACAVATADRPSSVRLLRFPPADLAL
ncbi:4'-phosphopantetheinyl transferase [Granulicella aggregans]|uniref:4'-phosphopantetheinyl transferase n=2 Tax=Granulicella aggregans TaxID=474949 RepID=A0A7W7ZBG5_9BACT|nr:4'-phosphopantetheinyl transferase [Granulicella aggregans]